MRRSIAPGLAAVAMMAVAMPVAAQDNATTVLRVDKLEKEMRAVQRKVFGTTGGIIEPEMGPQQTTPAPVGSSAPIADLTARVDAIEAQLARLTGTVEQNSFRLKQLEGGFAALKANAGAAAVTPVTPPASGSGDGGATPPATNPAPTAAAPAKASADRLAKVKAVEVPTTGNAAEDSYNYGFRLWSAGLYPEAQAQLEKLVKDYPKFPRMSFARNLLGRAYMDDKQYENAVHTLYDNYKSNPKGERAPDSLMYLGMTFSQMKNKQASCTAFGELFKVYGDSMNASLRSQASSERSKAGCA